MGRIGIMGFKGRGGAISERHGDSACGALVSGGSRKTVLPMHGAPARGIDGVVIGDIAVSNRAVLRSDPGKQGGGEWDITKLKKPDRQRRVEATLDKWDASVCHFTILQRIKQEAVDGKPADTSIPRVGFNVVVASF